MKDDIYAIDHYAVTVRDLDETRKFYEDILGFEVIDRQDNNTLPYYAELIGLPDAKFNIINMKGYGIVIEFLEYFSPGKIEMDTQANITGSAHLAFRVKDVFKLYEEWGKKGVNLCAKRAVCIEEGRHKGICAFYFKDPNGFILEVVSRPD